MRSTVQPPGHKVLVCRSFRQTTSGVEVLAEDAESVDGLLSSIRCMGSYGFIDKSVHFVLMRLPMNLGSADLGRISRFARGADMLGKLKLICGNSGPSTRETLHELSGLGVSTILGGVGTRCLLGDLVSNTISGFMLDDELVQTAVGDPYAASALDAITGLARNLEIKTFASCVTGMATLATLESAGVDYVSVTQFESAAPAVSIAENAV